MKIIDRIDIEELEHDLRSFKIVKEDKDPDDLRDEEICRDSNLTKNEVDNDGI